MKGDIYALNCAGCLTTQLVDGGDLEHYQINEDDHLYKTHCPSCKRIMLVPALTYFMNVVHMAPRPPFVPYVPKSAAQPHAAIPPVGPASTSRPLATSASESPQLCESDENKEKSYIQYLDTNSLYGWTNIFDDEDYIDLVNPDELDRILESYDLLEQEAYEANDVNNEEPFLRYDGTD